MNFLAHCALGGRSDALLVGSFLGDFVKGSIPASLPPEVGRGVRLHRRIDAFSNEEPHIRASVARLPVALRRFAPAFVDLLADHLLARRFELYHDEVLEDFSRRAYGAIELQRGLLPPRADRFFEFMQAMDLFDRYRDLSAVERAFARIMERLDRPEVVAPMVSAAIDRYDELETDFARYYPSLMDHAHAWLCTDG